MEKDISSMTRQLNDNKSSSKKLIFLPLYKQIEGHLTKLIVAQRWKPGEMLPNEYQLAEELNVSQGTMRKALNSLTSSKILTRKQGIGTFVSEHNALYNLNRFFPLISDDKALEAPKSELLSVSSELVNKEVAKALNVKVNSQVIVLHRRRSLRGEFCIVENIYLPYHYFKALEVHADIPNELYHFYQTQFNLTVTNTKDNIKATLATLDDETILGIKQGSPILEVTRVTTALGGEIIEYRISRCRCDNYHYFVEVN